MSGDLSKGVAERRSPGLSLALRTAGGVRPLARRVGLSAASVCRWEEVPRERVVAVAAALGLMPEQLRPDLAAFFEAERERDWFARARSRFAISTGLTEGATVTLRTPERPDPGTMDLLDLGLVIAALKFASAHHGLNVRSVISAPPGGAGGSPTPEQSARSLGMALACVVGRVSSMTVAGIAGVTRQAVENATERYLRQRDGDDPELARAGRVTERGRVRRAKAANDETWALERRFVRQLTEGAA